MSKAEDLILDAIDILVKKAVDDIKSDKTIIGNILEVLSGDRYKVLVNGAEYELQGSPSDEYVVGQSVDVFIPLNDYSRMEFKGTSSGGGGSIVENDPTVPSWAKQPLKPTYTAEEVKAVPDNNVITNIDIYNIINS